MWFGRFWDCGVENLGKHIWERDLVCWEFRDCGLCIIIELEGNGNLSMVLLFDMVLSNSPL